ncbi:MAG: CPBP family intramembrane metalloprotease [Clostridia bacterium]|nr:CPBP family intramembrane metalloprotease [Clostridia bacterium]
MSKMKFSIQPDTGTLSEQDAKRYFSTVGLGVAVLMVLFYGCNFGLTLACAKVAPHLLDNVWAVNLLSLLPLYGIAFPVFYLILRRLPRDRVSPEKMGAGSFFGGICVALLLMMAGNYVANMVIYAVELLTGRSLVNPVQTMTEGNAWWINLIFMVLVAPLLEELVFRKILCDRLLPLGEGYAVVLSAAIFGLIHGNFYQFFYAFLLGALFALLYIKTGRIRYSVLYHGLINLLGGVLAPWVLEKLAPLLEEETLLRMATDPMVAAELMRANLLPLMLMMLYETVLMGGSVLGVILLIRGRRRIHLAPGLLPPPKEGRVANVFCNIGVAAALTVFAGIFILSLL